MQVIVSGKHLEVTEALQEHATQKAQKACDHLSQLPAHCKVILSQENHANNVEFIVHHQGHDFVANASNNKDMYVAIDSAANKLRRQLDDFNSKQNINS